MKLFKEKTLIKLCASLSVFTLVAYHFPFFNHVFNNIEKGFNGILIIFSLGVLMLSANYMIYYIILYTGKIIGKIILSFSFIANAITLYFINTYEVLVTEKMMGNVFNTQYSEASGFFSWIAFFYILFLGIIPCVYLFATKIKYNTLKVFFINTGVSLGIILSITFANMKNWPWIDKNSTEIGSLLMPWSYTVNSIRYYNSVKKKNKKEILLPDAIIANKSKDVCILIIGESARRENFSLYGYHKQTNPLLEKDSVTIFNANASATYTTAGVKAILDHQPTNKLYEVLPNYLYRNGVDVQWRSNNWGEPPIHIKNYYKAKDILQMFPTTDIRYDEFLLQGLSKEIENSTKDKLFIVLHTTTSHGPTYHKKYPKEFEIFTPVCNTVEMSKAIPEELINAYDNTIIYTDYLIHSVIDILKQNTQRRSCMIFVSDHGESLGENNLYMHGVPMSMAPKEQIEIPFITWTSDKNLKTKKLEEVSQYHVFHSVINFLGIESPIFNEDRNIFINN